MPCILRPKKEYSFIKEMASVVEKATKISLLVQAVTGIIGFYGLGLPLAPSDVVLRQVLSMELLVQSIEFVFYVGFLTVPTLAELTLDRYYDWFLSTPMMLFTTSLYFFYVNFVENVAAASAEGSTEPYTLTDYVNGNTKQILTIVFLNFLMLLFGFLSELGVLERGTAFVLGTGALIGSFATIYENYAKHSEKTRGIFWVMFGLWSMYGVGFLWPPVAKNLAYTVLDIFAKNFFGLFLTFVIAGKGVTRS